MAINVTLLRGRKLDALVFSDSNMDPVKDVKSSGTDITVDAGSYYDKTAKRMQAFAEFVKNGGIVE